MRRAVMVLVAVSCLSVFALRSNRGGTRQQEHPGKRWDRQDQVGQDPAYDGQTQECQRAHRVIGQTNKRPDLVRQTFTMQGMTAVQAYDGSTGWQTNLSADAKILS